MGMLEKLEQEINNLNLFVGNIPPIVDAIADSIPSRTIPRRMKLALAIEELMLFASQFRINIQHWNGSIIPINSIMFIIAKSGASKDSSMKAARKCFNSSYEKITKARNEAAVIKAINKARENGVENYSKFAGYKDYYLAPNPLFVAISTPEGFIQHLNDLSEDSIGAGYIYSGEFGAELSSNNNLIENIKALAELYDEGSKEVKILKARENQSKEVKNLPVSALFIGSQDNLLFDETIKQKFKTEFTSKLARRSFFIFVNDAMEEEKYDSIFDMIEEEKRIEDNAILQRNEVSKYVEEITEELLPQAGKFTLSVSDEVRNIFTIYKRYNEELSSTMDNQFPIAKLTRAHMQWKALKLAGALALIDCSENIDVEHYKAAIEFVELISADVGIFEKELVKEPYELFTEYVKNYSVNGEYKINLHNLRKFGFIPMKGQSSTNMKELVKLANSYDENGIYSLKDDVITYKELTKSNKILVSYLESKGSKQYRAANCSSGYICEECEFSDIENLLQGSFAYIPFRFSNGKRSIENINSPCKWIVLDIDDSAITDEEAHLLISDINHYVVRTSNKDNPNKYRVLIELDTEVDIPATRWIDFIQFIAQDLGFNADKLSKSQIFFSYEGRDILSTIDASPLEVKPYINMLSETTKEKKPISKINAVGMLGDPFTTFDRAFNAKDGEGRRKIIWSIKYARDLGANKDYCHKLVDQIDNYWVKGLPEQDLAAIHRQIERMSFED